MKIAQITPGTGDSFYCENCLRDLSLVKAFDRLGQRVELIPMYLPSKASQQAQVPVAPMFFGGINVFLQQKLSLFRKTPRWLDRLFDAPKLLRWAGHQADMVDARDLGETTISMLQGEHGRQVKELRHLIDWLVQRENKPDIVCLSNALLAGLARAIKRELSIPVVCLLQDEDEFLDSLRDEYRGRAWRILSERANDIDTFIAVSDYYAKKMREKLTIDPARVEVLHTGIETACYKPAQNPPEKPTVGYLSRLCQDKGLDILADAFIILKKNDKLKDARLRIAGGHTTADEPFVKAVRKKLSDAGVSEDVLFLDNFDDDAKLAFLQTLSVMCVPERRPPACGLYVLEALAAGVPVVEPRAGDFIELINHTDGGLLYEPNDPPTLAATLEKLLLDRDLAQELAHQGRNAVIEKFDIDRTAGKMVDIYQKTLTKSSRG